MIRLVLVAACAAALFGPVAQAQAPYTRFGEAPAAPAVADADADAAAWRGWSQRSAAALAARGQARDLALAAVLQAGAQAGAPPAGDTPSVAVAPDAQSAAWRREAAAVAGDDVVANALLGATGDADIRVRAAQRWLGAEPQNLAPLLVRGGSVDVLLADARSATGFDLHMLDQVRWMQAALQRTPPTPAERAAFADGDDFVPAEHAAVTAAALWSAGIPDLQPLTEACTASATRANPVRARDCRHVAEVMAGQSDTLLGRLVGLDLLAQLAATPAERAAVQAQRRSADWTLYEWGRASAALPRDGAAQFVRLLADGSIRAEAALIERALQEAGVAPEPPAGWQPPH